MDMIQLYEEKEHDMYRYLMDYGNEYDFPEHEVGYLDMFTKILDKFLGGEIVHVNESDPVSGTLTFVFKVDDVWCLSWVEYGSCTVCDEFQRAFWRTSPSEKAGILLNIILTFCQNTTKIEDVNSTWELKTEIEKLTKENEILKKENKRVNSMKESVYKQFYDAVKAVVYRFEKHGDDIR